MKKFKNIKSGLIYETNNYKVIEQFENHTDLYKEYKEELTLNDLKAKAKSLGIKFDKNVKKAELLALIQNIE